MTKRADAHIHLFADGYRGGSFASRPGVTIDEAVCYDSLAREHDVAAALVVGYGAEDWCTDNNSYVAEQGPNFDWVPDQDHGGVLLKALQAMLVQTDGKTIYLLPAWPKDWNADFKVHAPYQTVLEGRVRDGKIVALDVRPPERKIDVIINPRP